MTENESREAGRSPGISDGPHTEAVRSDTELLQAYVQTGDELAFAGLVQRHSGMVWKVCRLLLQEIHDAEDAFQATFLVLVRQAGRIRRPEQLANWLYGVAYRVAMRLRSQSARRHRQEGQDIAMTAVAAPLAGSSDLEPIVCEEVNRLPEKYRGAVVMCYLEGKTNEEVAAALGRPVGTIKGWLSRAREILKRRMTRRGIVFPAAWMATDLASGVAQEVAPPALAENTVQACLHWAHAGVQATPQLPTRVVHLADEVVRGFQRVRNRAIAAIVAGAGALAVLIGAGILLALYRHHLPPKTDLDKIRGAWQFAAMRKDGMRMAAPAGVDQGRWIFTDTEVIFDFGKQLKYQLKIDPTKTPKTMDAVLVDPVKGQIGAPWEWIYEIEGEMLKIAVPELPNRVRPRNFDAGPGSGSMVMFLRRPPEFKK